MVFDTSKLSDLVNDFIPLTRFDSETHKGVEHTIFVNKNTITSFSYVKVKDRECLLLKFDYNKMAGTALPREFNVCKDENPVAFHKLFRGVPDKLPKYNFAPF